jgi:O-6-methylguanine DNA methyltransferase
MERSVAGFLFIVSADETSVMRSVIRPDRDECITLRKIPERMNGVLLAVEKFIDRYLSGGDAQIPAVDLSACTDAQRKVYRTCMEIHFGERMSYGTLARAAGFPRAARFAGSCMRKNRFQLLIPCHRVVPASGGIGLYSGGEDVKKALLDFERKLSGQSFSQ